MTPQKIALERAQLSRMTNLYANDGTGGGNSLDPTPQTYWNGTKFEMESPGQATIRAKNAAAYHATETEANAHNSLVAKANAFAQAHQATPQYVMKPFPELNVPSGVGITGLNNDLSNATIETPPLLARPKEVEVPPLLAKPKDEEDENG